MFSIDTLNQDIDRIQNSTFNNTQKDLLLFIANSYINRKIDSARFDVIKGLKNNFEGLNFEMFNILLDDVLNHTMSESDYISTIAMLGYNNPDTKFTHSNFIGGSFYRELSDDTISYILNQLYEIYPNVPTFMIFYADYFCEKNPKKAFAICEELIRRLKTRDLTQHNSYANEILRRRGMICYAITKSSIALNTRTAGLKLVNEYERFLDFTDKKSSANFYYYKALLFEQINIDSAKYFYALAHKAYPQASSIKDDFNKFAESTLKIQNAAQILDSLSNSIIESFRTMPTQLNTIQLSDGTNFDLKNSEVPVLIYRSSITCSPCKKELKNLAEISFESANKPLLLFTNKEHYDYLKKNNKLPKNFDVNCIKDGNQTCKVLNINADPSSVLIIKRKIVLKNIGYNAQNKNLIKATIDESFD